MKVTTLSRKLFHSAFATVLAIVIACGFSAPPAQAGYTVTLLQVGSNVVATGTGAIDATDLTPFGTVLADPFILPNSPLGGAAIVTGQDGLVDKNFLAALSGPSMFGSGSAEILADSGAGGIVGILFNSSSPSSSGVFLPASFVNDVPFSSSATWLNKNFSDLGVTAGTYEWTWGTGTHADFYKLQIGPAAGVPDSGTTASLFGFSLAGLAFLRRKLA